MTAAPAAAQAGAAVSVFSDYRFRGFSLSESRPVGILDISYDGPNGVYTAASASVVAARGEGLRPLGVQVNGGYAKALRSGLIFDIGAVHARYSSYSELGSSRSYTELYAGVRGKVISSRITVSPDYLGLGSTLYGEVTGRVAPARNLQLQASVGTLVPLGGGHDYRTTTDGRLGLDWTSGRLSLHGSITTRAGGRNLYPLRHSSRTALVFGFSYAL